MVAQAFITKSVIDGPLRTSQYGDVLTHDEIREELIRQIDAGQLRQADVARKLAIAPARVAEMRKRERKVQQDEMPILARLLGLSESGPNVQRIEESVRIPHLGKVAQGVWLEQSIAASDIDELEYVAYDRLRGDPPTTDLFAVTPDGTSMNKRFLDGTLLICRRIPFGIGSVKSGDYVIVERAAHDLREMTCKRLEVDNDGVYWLHSESFDERYKEPWRIGKPDHGMHLDNEVQIIAKVIRAVQDFERGSN